MLWSIISEETIWSKEIRVPKFGFQIEFVSLDWFEYSYCNICDGTRIYITAVFTNMSDRLENIQARLKKIE